MNKLEEHIKEKLAERKIVPSKDSWDRVASGMSGPTKVQSNKRFLFYTVAACFIGFLAIGFVYITNTSNTLPLEVTDTTEKEPPVFQPQSIAKKENASNSELVVVKKAAEPITTGVIKTRITSNATNEEPLLKDVPQLNEVATKDFSSKENALIAEKLDLVLAKVSTMEANNTAVTEAEVDSLLRIAQKELLADNVLQQSGKVDAMALLIEVEDELNQTFRDRLFQKLKEGFFKVHTAVVDRNNQ